MYKTPSSKISGNYKGYQIYKFTKNRKIIRRFRKIYANHKLKLWLIDQSQKANTNISRKREYSEKDE